MSVVLCTCSHMKEIIWILQNTCSSLSLAVLTCGGNSRIPTLVSEIGEEASTPASKAALLSMKL